MALSVDQDLDVVWHQVVARINEKSKLFTSDTKFLDQWDIDDVVQRIKPPEKSEKGEKARVVFKNVLLALQQFGDVIGSATAAVFEPCKQCITAVNILIVAVQKAEKLFDDVVTLLERVTVFLNSLNVWLKAQASLDMRLRRPVYQVLEHFMEIIALTHNLTRRSAGEWSKAFVKGVFLGGDQRIVNAMTMLETRVSDVTRIQIAVICKDLGDAAISIRELKGDMELMLRNETHQIVVLDSVNIKVDHLVDDQDLHYVRQKVGTYAEGTRWRKTHADLRYTRPGTGDWLFEQQDFKDWQSKGSIFMIKADRGRGRTNLAYAIINHLKPQAYHYLQPWARGKSQALEAALSIIWQLAERNREYCRLVRRSDVDWSDKFELWKKLIMPQPITIVLENADDADTRWTFGRVLAEKFKFKICLLGNLKNIEHFEGLNTPIVQLDGDSLSRGSNFPNAHDVALCIDHRLDSFADLQKLGMREQVKLILLGIIQNDFTTLYPMLDEIGHCKNQRQLSAFLEAIPDKAIDRIENMIEGLNRRLSQREIIELNEILSWLSFAFNHETDLDYLRQYLASRDITVDQKCIETKYNYVLTIEYGRIRWRDAYIKDYLASRSEFERLTKRRHRQPLDPEEAELVKVLIRTNLANVLGSEGKAIYDRYGFDQFFQEKMGVHTARIRLDEGESHVALLNACITALTTYASHQDLYDFRRYAATYLHNHMHQAAMRTASSDTCQSIAVKLADFLTDRHKIDRYWRSYNWTSSEYAPHTSTVIYADDYRSWLEWIDELPSKHKAREWYNNLGEDDILYDFTLGALHVWEDRRLFRLQRCESLNWLVAINEYEEEQSDVPLDEFMGRCNLTFHIEQLICRQAYNEHMSGSTWLSKHADEFPNSAQLISLFLRGIFVEERQADIDKCWRLLAELHKENYFTFAAVCAATRNHFSKALDPDDKKGQPEDASAKLIWYAQVVRYVLSGASAMDDDLLSGVLDHIQVCKQLAMALKRDHRGLAWSNDDNEVMCTHLSRCADEMHRLRLIEQSTDEYGQPITTEQFDNGIINFLAPTASVKLDRLLRGKCCHEGYQVVLDEFRSRVLNAVSEDSDDR